MKRFSLLTVTVALTVATLASPAPACPFCSAVQMTFTEEIDASDMAVLAELVEPPASSGELDALDPEAAADAARAKFRVVEVLKGESLVKPNEQIETLYFGDGTVGTRFLIMGIEPPDAQWSTPIEVSSRVEEYIHKMLSLGREDVARLLHAIHFLEDEEEALRRDSYDEFAKTPYDRVKLLRGQIDHDQLVAWIQDPETPASRQRLYFTLLGVNGSESDLPMLEEMITSDDKKRKTGLDSMIACYVQLGGPDMLPLIEQEFIRNEEAEYTDTYAALMALRFHGQETDVVPKKRLVQTFRLMLDRPKLADLVIPDLARWEDWDAIPQMVELFKNADKSTSWVRVPVVNFLRACPLPEAQERLEELAKIDPDAVKRASTFFPLSGSTTRPGTDAEPTEGKQETNGEGDSAVEQGDSPAAANGGAADEAAAQETAADLPPSPTGLGESEKAIAAAPHDKVTVDESDEPATAAIAEPPALVWMVGVPVAAVLLLLAAYIMILRTPRPARRGEAAAELAGKD
ncbi:MAG: hypothetical protein WEA31_10165 [Pirellulales bacterium]